jgi:hypothetical protein
LVALYTSALFVSRSEKDCKPLMKNIFPVHN